MTQKIFDNPEVWTRSLFVYTGKEYNEQLQLDAVEFAEDKHAYDNELQSEEVYIVCDGELTIEYTVPTYEEARDYCNRQGFC